MPAERTSYTPLQVGPLDDRNNISKLSDNNNISKIKVTIIILVKLIIIIVK